MKMETATFAAGCFWCTEALFQRLKGVQKVISGYAGGDMNDPSYDAVSTGKTGHAEAIQITFDPSVITYEELLDVFWHTHDPTTPNQQGADVGTQYRSVVFTHSDAQRESAEEVLQRLDESGEFKSPIVTEVLPFEKFYPAEEYHQDFYNANPSHSYCQIVIDPKLEKLVEKYSDKVK